MTEWTMPMFPLPLVLYPGITMPLHIFEDRYKQLVTDIAGVGGVFGIVQVEADPDDPEAARLHTVGTLARITDMQALPEGRCLIEIQGEERFRVLDWQGGHPYATARIATLDEDDGSEPVADAVRDRFAAYVSSLFNVVRIAPPELPEHTSPRALSYVVAAMLQVTPDEKQFLLACPTTDERLATLLQLLGRESRRISDFSDRVRGQGKQFVGGVPFSLN